MKFLEKDSSDSWNTVPPVVTSKITNVNCHKFVLYAIDKISWEEMFSDPHRQEEVGIDFTYGKIAQDISDIPFAPINSLKSLLIFANEKCEIGKTYVGQILDTETNTVAHSFIVVRESHDRYTCFDKPGFKYPFKTGNFDQILNFVNKDAEKPYENQKWRFVPITLKSPAIG